MKKGRFINMKKVYVAPDVKLAIHGTLESVFASGVVCGREKQLSNWPIGSDNTHKVTLKSNCKNYNTWSVHIENDNLYGTDQDEE